MLLSSFQYFVAAVVAGDVGEPSAVGIERRKSSSFAVVVVGGGGGDGDGVDDAGEGRE